MISCMSNNIKCDTASSGSIALKLIKKRAKKVITGSDHMYKAILMDYSMPEMDGPCTAIAIRKLLKKYSTKKNLS